MKKLIWIGLAFLVILVGCDLTNRDFYRSEDDFPEEGKGALILLLDDSEIPSKTIVPDILMEVATYDISGTQTSGGTNTFTDTTTSPTYAVNDLAPGIWDITVTVSNTVPQVIGSGQALDITISAGSITTTSVDVFPIVGFGSLSLTLTWPMDSVPDPYIIATITPKGGTETSLDFLPVDPINTATYTEAALSRETGYYILQLALWGGNGKEWGMMESVRIIDGLETSWNKSLTLDPGGLTLSSINVNLQNPIDITFDSIPTSPWKRGTDFTVTAQPSSGYSYQWYEDGSIISGANTATLTFGSSLSVGNHNIGVLVTDTDTLSSNSFTIEIAEPEIAVMQGTTELPDGTGTFDFGNVTVDSSSSAIVFSIENSGKVDLLLTGSPDLVTLSGTDAADFSITSQPASSTVGASASEDFSITFTPSSTGSKTATVSIGNDDTDENPYTFTVTGTGQ